jgi:hypothetical protein
MPLALRIVTPVRLSRTPVTEEYRFDLDIVTNTTLAGCIRQLSSVAQKADEIFANISQECQNVINRTSRLTNRVKDITTDVEHLDAKAVRIPVGDLTSFANETEHFSAEYGYDCYLFTPGGRPDAISELYEASTVSPLKAIRRCNMLRTDGKTGSRIFSLTPILQNEKTDTTEEADINFRKRQSVRFKNKPLVAGCFERETKKLPEPTLQQRPKSLSALTEFDIYTNTSKIYLPTPEERLREISRSQPVTLIPIDTSGQPFNRMCEQRASQRSINKEYVETGSSTVRRTKRRQTLSGIPGFVYEELTKDNPKIGSIRTRSVSRERWERPRSMNVTDHMYSHVDPTLEPPRGRRSRSRERRRHASTPDRDESPVFRSCSLRRSFRSLFNKTNKSRSKSSDFWADGRPESPGPPEVDLHHPLRRSKSLPRSLRSLRGSTGRLNTSRSASTEGRLDAWSEEEDHHVDSDTQELVRGKPPKPPLSVTNRLSRPMHRSRSHTASLSTSTFTDPWPTPGRPRSMNLGQRQPIPVAPPTTPSTDSHMTGSESLSSQMNIPAGQPAWTAFAADVKLRQQAAIKDDRQSSSGNWSGSSSSARQSLESGEYTKNGAERRSQTSLDKDSALSLNIHSSSANSEERYDTTDNNAGEETSTVTGETSTITGDNSTINGDEAGSEDGDGSVIDIRSHFTTMTADEWLKTSSSHKDKRKSLHRKSRTIPGSGSSTDTTDSASGLTMERLRAHDYAHLPLVRQPSRGTGDESSSVYSVDQDGFYTSMHRDSGLHRRSYGDTLYEEPDSKMAALSSFSSESTLNGQPSTRKDKKRRSSGLFSNLSLKRNTKGGPVKTSKKNNKRIPPPPPPRLTTKLDKSNLTLHMDESEASKVPSPRSNFSPPPSANLTKVLALPWGDSKVVSPPLSHLNDSSCESDAEVVYARLKLKTSISTAAYPSMCDITPIQSDEEDADLLPYLGGAIYGPTGTLKNSPLSPYQPASGASTNASSTPVSSGAGTIVAIDVSGNSTWPNTPTGPENNDNKLSSFTADYQPPVPPSMVNHGTAPIKMFTDEDEVRSSKILDGAQTPEAMIEDDRSTLTRSNSFRGSVDGSVGQRSEMSSVDGSVGQTSERSGSSGSKVSSSLLSYPASQSSSSIPSSISDEHQQLPLPPKYLHSIKVRPGGKDAKPGKACVNVTHIDDTSIQPPAAAAVGHFYANVIVQNNDLNSPSGSEGFGCGPALGVASSTPKDKPCDFMGTWPRASKTSLNAPSSPLVGAVTSSKDDTHTPASRPLSLTAATAEPDFGTFPRKADRNHFASSVKVACLPIDRPAPYTGPVAAPAKLIISSPVATKISFKENPYKRSLCSPVTTQELLSIWNSNKPSKSLSDTPIMETNIDADLQGMSGVCTPLSQPLYPTLGSMKHSITFPVETKAKSVVPSDYGRTWYDGIAPGDKKKKATTPGSLPEDYFQMEPQISFSSFLKDQGKPCTQNLSLPFDQRRDSVSSSVSTDSGGKAKTFASIKKASPASSRSSLRLEEEPIQEQKDEQVVPERSVPKFTSFNKGIEGGLGMKRSASSGSETTLTVQPAVVVAVKPTPAVVVAVKPTPAVVVAVKTTPAVVGAAKRSASSSIETTPVVVAAAAPKSPSPPRPTHLSLIKSDSFKKAKPYYPAEPAKPAEPDAKRLKTTPTEEKVLVNPTQRKPSPVRVIFPHTPEKKKATSPPRSLPNRPKIKPPSPPKSILSAYQKRRSPTSPRAGSPIKMNSPSKPMFSLPVLKPWPGVKSNKVSTVVNVEPTKEASPVVPVSSPVVHAYVPEHSVIVQSKPVIGNTLKEKKDNVNDLNKEAETKGVLKLLLGKKSPKQEKKSSPKQAKKSPKEEKKSKKEEKKEKKSPKGDKKSKKEDTEDVPKPEKENTAKAVISKVDPVKVGKTASPVISRPVAPPPTIPIPKPAGPSPVVSRPAVAPPTIPTPKPATPSPVISRPEVAPSPTIPTPQPARPSPAISRPVAPPPAIKQQLLRPVDKTKTAVRPVTPVNLVQAQPCVTPTKKPIVSEVKLEAPTLSSPGRTSCTVASRPVSGPVLSPPAATRPATGPVLCRPAPGPVLTPPSMSRPASGPMRTPPTAYRPAAGPILQPPPSAKKTKDGTSKETTFGSSGDITTCHIASKPPPSPAAYKHISQTPPVRRMSRSLSVCSNNADKPAPCLSSSLNTSTTSLTSASNLSLLNTSGNLGKSSLSLARSTDSLASNSSGSARAERNRLAKLAFLAQQEENMTRVAPPTDDPFARFKVGPKKVVNGVKDSNGSPRLNGITDSNSNTNKRKDSVSSNDGNTSNKRKDSVSSSSGSCSPKGPSASPVQGRFVSSMMSQFQSGSESPTSPTSGSSGLGSSLPSSPEKVLASLRTRQHSGGSSSGSTGSSPPPSPRTNLTSMLHTQRAVLRTVKS